MQISKQSVDIPDVRIIDFMLGVGLLFRAMLERKQGFGNGEEFTKGFLNWPGK